MELKEAIEYLKTRLSLLHRNYQFATEQAIEIVLQALENSIPKQVVTDKINKLEKEYKEALDENSTKAFILKCQIEGFKEFEKELLEGK